MASVWRTSMLLLIFTFCKLSQGMPDFCLLTPAWGPCGDKLHKFYYAHDLRTCRVFIFGGCPVNDNVFNDFETCMDVCVRNKTAVTTTSTTTTPAPSPEELYRRSFAEMPYVVLGNGSGNVTFTFASPSSYIQIGPQQIAHYQIRNRRSVSLEFRTRLAHALLLYHGIKDRPSQMKKYELYIMLDQGQLRVKHLFGDHSTTVIVGKGLNRDKFHHVNVLIDPDAMTIQATVDQHNTSAMIDGLEDTPSYGAELENLDSIIFIGGGLVAAEEHLDISYLANPFVGCIRKVTLATSPLISLPLEPITSLVSTRFHNVAEGCINKCWDVRQPCSFDSRCINFYDHVECDCFKARFKGDECRSVNVPVLSLYGYSYVTFTAYEWMDRVHSDANRIGIHFRTQVDDSILFYAAGEIPYHNHIGASIHNRSLHISLDFGDANVDPIEVQIRPDGSGLIDGNWHVLTVTHHGKEVKIHLDGQERVFELQGNRHHLYIDPDIYIGGGGPRLRNRQGTTVPGLHSSNNFVGCIKEVYFNEKSVLWELHAKRHQAQYHGLMDPAISTKEGCDVQNTVPITVPFAESGFRISNPAPEEFNLKFEFRTSEIFGTLASADIRTLKHEGFWELQVTNENIQFVLVTNKQEPENSASKPLSAKFNRRASDWSSIQLKYVNGEIHLTTDRTHVKEEFLELFQLSGYITLGTSVTKRNTGFVGCIRRVQIGDKHVDTRKIVGSEDQIGDIAIDNCQFQDPCSRPKVCEHGGKCSVQEGQVSCDCSETGYIGKHCHFSIYKRTCEELALLGYTESGVYKIDIDGNGPFIPAHVKCKFETDSSGETKTIVEHNLANETDIWNPNDEKPFDFKMNLRYREFSPDMLISLVSQSVQCSQHIKYDCYKTQLSLQRSSWFKASDPNSISVVSIGDAERHSCPCYTTKTCANKGICNCDSLQDKWLSDEGYFSIPERLGITELVFMVPNNLTKDSASRITLGPLECVEANTQRYVVTFKTFGSFLEAPGWKAGDLAFSFRTTRSSAILLYQPLLHHQHNAFSVFLTSDHELVFRFILNGGPPKEVVVRSQRPLSGGDWQQVWIDYDLHQVRFQINAEHQMITLPDGQLFGPFESTMYIAGAPSKYLEAEPTIVQDGLIGCFRGLVMNGQVVDLYSYMKFHKADIVKDCSPSCDPNPCKNKAICQENWGSFTCQCQNPWAQSGQYCEKDINVNGLTFLSQSSFARIASMDATNVPVRNILTSNFYANLRTYDSEALVVYANDNLNNFIQIHIEGGTRVIFSWNDGNTIRQLNVYHKALNHGKEIQIAVTRNTTQTSLHVNHENATAFVGISLLTDYSPTPWKNPELETFSPPRPFASVNTYYQLLLGGYDRNALVQSNTSTRIPGMLGCLKGLMVGSDPIKISGFANQNDVLEGCKMVCDTRPCANSGLCIEDFQARTYSCNCMHTSYFGPTCSDEKGASFQGESSIRRTFKYREATVPEIETHFGFSTSYAEEGTLLLLVSMPSQSYSLLFAINEKGHLILQEERDGMVFDAVIEYQNFVDGSRHSIYFERSDNQTLFIVDQEEIRLRSASAKLVLNSTVPIKDPTVYVAGVSEGPLLLNRFRRFKGCLSNVVVKVGETETRALEEFFGFRKKDVDVILDPEKLEGIKLGQCAAFSLFRRAPPSVDAQPGDKALALGGSDWVLRNPEKEPIHLRPPPVMLSSTISFKTMAIIFAVFLGSIIFSVGIYAYRLNKRYRRRMLEEFDEDDVYFTHRGHPVHYKDPMQTELQYTGYGKIDPETDNLIKSKPAANNNETKLNDKHSKAQPDAGQKDIEADQGIDDENASSDTSSDGKLSHVSSASSLSLNNTQVLDDKDEEPLVLRNGSSSLPNCEPIEEVTESEDHDDDPNPRLPSLRLARRNMSPTPIYLSPSIRTFEASPIAMIGGQRDEMQEKGFPGPGLEYPTGEDGSVCAWAKVDKLDMRDVTNTKAMDSLFITLNTWLKARNPVPTSSGNPGSPGGQVRRGGQRTHRLLIRNAVALHQDILFPPTPLITGSETVVTESSPCSEAASLLSMLTQGGDAERWGSRLDTDRRRTPTAFIQHFDFDGWNNDWAEIQEPVRRPQKEIPDRTEDLERGNPQSCLMIETWSEAEPIQGSIELNKGNSDSWVDLLLRFGVTLGTPAKPTTLNATTALETELERHELSIHVNKEYFADSEREGTQDPNDLVNPLQGPTWEKLNPAFMFATFIVTHVSGPEKFFLQREATVDAVDQLNRSMTLWYTQYTLNEKHKKLPFHQIRKNGCYAGFIESTGAWMRICILNITYTPEITMDKIHAILLDNGSECILDVDHVQLLHKDFCTLPVQVFQAQLHANKTQSSYSRWTNQDIAQFRAELQGQQFYCGILERNTEGTPFPTLSVVLFVEEGDRKQRIFTFNNRLEFHLY